jgi:hypothetical protein
VFLLRGLVATPSGGVPKVVRMPKIAARPAREIGIPTALRVQRHTIIRGKVAKL